MHYHRIGLGNANSGRTQCWRVSSLGPRLPLASIPPSFFPFSTHFFLSCPVHFFSFPSFLSLLLCKWSYPFLSMSPFPPPKINIPGTWFIFTIGNWSMGSWTWPIGCWCLDLNWRLVSQRSRWWEFIWVGISSIQMYILGAVWTVVPVTSVWGQQWQLPRPQQRNNSMTFTLLGWPAFCSFSLFSGCVFPHSLEIPWAVRYLFNKFLFYLN